MVATGPSSELESLRHEFSRASAYASEYYGNTPQAYLFNTRMKRVCDLLRHFTNGRVLDAGCGPAIVRQVFLAWPIQYYGIDLSEDMIAECKSRFGQDPQCHISIGTIDALPFPDSCFDVVLCLGALEYIPDLDITMTEFARVVKPNGHVIVTMQNASSPYRLWSRYAFEKLLNGREKCMCFLRGERHGRSGGEPRRRPAFRVHSARRLRDAFASAGVSVEDVLYYNFNVFFPPLDTLFPRGSVYVSRNLESHSSCPLKYLGTDFIVKGKKDVKG